MFFERGGGLKEMGDRFVFSAVVRYQFDSLPEQMFSVEHAERWLIVGYEDVFAWVDQEGLMTKVKVIVSP